MGQLGYGERDPFPVLSPVDVRLMNNAIKVTAGSSHSCALRETGRVACWGLNGQGQLGDGTLTNRYERVAVRFPWMPGGDPDL